MKTEYRFSEKMQLIEPSGVRKIMQSASGVDGLISFGCGMPAPVTFPHEEIRQACDELLMNNYEQVLQYSSTMGLDELRDLIIRRMSLKFGIKGLTKENVCMLSGSQQGIDFVGRVFVSKGDVVFVERPSYTAAINAFTASEAKLVDIEMDEEGIIIDDLKKKMEMYPDAKFLYTIPDFQNPSGHSMSTERKKQLIEACKGSKLLIIEDAPYTELRFEHKGSPAIKSLDTEDRVIYLGTLSKILAPGLRVGWIAGPKEVIEKIVIIKQVSDLQPNTFTEYVALQTLKTMDLDAHIESIVKLYSHRRDVMLEALEKYMPKGVTWSHPQGGIFLWLNFDKEVDAEKLCQRCIKDKVSFIPGASFYANDKENNHGRLNFSYCSDEEIVEGIKRIAKCLQE